MKLSKSKENAGQKAKKDVCFHPFMLWTLRSGTDSSE